MDDGGVEDGDAATGGGGGWKGLDLDDETSMPSFSCRQKAQMPPAAPAPAAAVAPGGYGCSLQYTAPSWSAAAAAATATEAVASAAFSSIPESAKLPLPMLDGSWLWLCEDKSSPHHCRCLVLTRQSGSLFLDRSSSSVFTPICFCTHGRGWRQRGRERSR